MHHVRSLLQSLVVFGLVLGAPMVASAQGGCPNGPQNAEEHAAFSQKYQQAEAWVKSQPAWALPQSLDEILPYHKAYRQVLFNALTPEKKSRFWTTHLNRILASEMKLTGEQLEVLHDALALAGDPASYVVEELESKALGQLVQRSQDAFGRDFVQQFFHLPDARRIGGTEPAEVPDVRPTKDGWTPACNCGGFFSCSVGSCIEVTCIRSTNCGILGIPIQCTDVCGFWNVP